MKVVLSGTPFLRHVQYDRTFLDNVKYEPRSLQYDRTFLDNEKYESKFVQYDRMFLDNIKYENLLNIFKLKEAISWIYYNKQLFKN